MKLYTKQTIRAILKHKRDINNLSLSTPFFDFKRLRDNFELRSQGDLRNVEFLIKIDIQSDLLKEERNYKWEKGDVGS